MAKMTRLLAALVLASAAAAGWYGIASAATCYTCHAPVGSTTDLRPVESTYRNITTGSIKGSHAKHIPAPTTDRNTCTPCHIHAADISFTTRHRDGFIQVSSVMYSKSASFPQSGNPTLGTCSAAICHGPTSPAWGTNTTNYACTKCHGAGTVTVTASNYEVVAPSGTSSDTGQVSTGKIGAHQTHLKYFNGLSQQGADPQARCQICHAVPGTNNHANVDSTPVFTGLALGTGTYLTSYNAGTCSVYCHNPAAATGGTLATTNAPAVTTVSWTDAAYIADVTLKTDANCNKCHKSPGNASFTSTVTHAAGITQDCSGCHGHNGGPGGAVGQQHMDGVKWGSGGAGGCVGCHGYGVGTWAAAPAINAEGKGAHEKHITYLTTKRFTITLAPLTDTYGGATTAWTNVCGICHTGGAHQNAAVDVSVSPTYLFGTGSTLYSGVSGTSSAGANKKTCSNISCHYFTTPLWSSY